MRRTIANGRETLRVGKASPARSATSIESAIAAGEVHGKAGAPDHEVGDPQALVRRLAAVMTADQIDRAMDGWESWAE